MTKLNPGDTLKNGAIVIRHSVKGEKVLAINRLAIYPYVYWSINENGDTFWGHYFDSITTAVLEFNFVCDEKVGQ